MRKFCLKSKKGLVLSEATVWVIIGLVSFVLIIMLFVQWNPKEDVKKQVCHQSVIKRATFRLTETTSVIPLKCQTEKYCIIAKEFLDKSECEEFLGEEDVETVEVEDLNDIEQFIARETLSCWETMGEGKLSLFSKVLADDLGLREVYPTCVVCSRIAFNEQSLNNAGIDLRDIDLMQYMMTHKPVAKDKTYFEIFSGGKSTGVSVGDTIGERINEQAVNQLESSLNPESEDVGWWSTITSWTNVPTTSKQVLEVDELGIVFMQISAPEHGNALLKLIGVEAGGFFILRSIPLIGGVVSGFTGGIVALAGGVVVVAGQQLSVWHSQGVTAGYCGDVSHGGEARSGCSAVKAVNYNAQEIQQFCSVIESMP